MISLAKLLFFLPNSTVCYLQVLVHVLFRPPPSPPRTGPIQVGELVYITNRYGGHFGKCARVIGVAGKSSFELNLYRLDETLQKRRRNVSLSLQLWCLLVKPLLQLCWRDLLWLALELAGGGVGSGVDASPGGFGSSISSDTPSRSSSYAQGTLPPSGKSPLSLQKPAISFFSCPDVLKIEGRNAIYRDVDTAQRHTY